MKAVSLYILTPDSCILLLNNSCFRAQLLRELGGSFFRVAVAEKLRLF